MYSNVIIAPFPDTPRNKRNMDLEISTLADSGKFMFDTASADIYPFH